MKFSHLFTLACILATYSTFAMQQQPQHPEALTLEQQKEAQRQTDIRDFALRVVMQEGHLGPEDLGPQFFHTFASLNTRTHGASYTELPVVTYAKHFAFSPDGRLCAFVTGKKNKETGREEIGSDIHVYNTQPYRLLDVLPCHDHAQCLAFSPDSRFLFSGSERVAHKWDIAQGTILEDFKYPDNLDNFSPDDFSPDCQSIVGKDVDRHTIVYNFATGTASRSEWGDNSQFTRFSPDGQKIVLGGGFGESRIIFYDTTRATHPISDAGISLIGNQMAISPSGKLLAGRGDHDASFSNIWKPVKILSMANGQVQQSIKPERQGLHFAFSHDDHIIAINNAKSIDFYEIKTGRLIQSIPFEIHANHIPDWAFIGHSNGALEFSSQHQLAAIEEPYCTARPDAKLHAGRVVIFDIMPQYIRAAFRLLTINQLLVLVSLIRPLAAGRVIHLTQGSNAWNLVHAMPEPLRDLLAPCLQPAGIVSRLTQAAEQHPALLSSVAAAASAAAYYMFRR